MHGAEPLLRAAAITVEVTAGAGSSFAAVRALADAHASVDAGALLTISGGSAAVRIGVLEVLSGRRPPAIGTVIRAVPDARVVRHVVGVETGTLLARSWAHLPGAARAGRTRQLDPAPHGRLHFILADGEGAADRPCVARLLAGLRAGDGIVLALPSLRGVPASVRLVWTLPSAPCVAALSRAS
jgi:hypothetical protein